MCTDKLEQMVVDAVTNLEDAIQESKEVNNPSFSVSKKIDNAKADLVIACLHFNVDGDLYRRCVKANEDANLERSRARL